MAVLKKTLGLFSLAWRSVPGFIETQCGGVSAARSPPTAPLEY